MNDQIELTLPVIIGIESIQKYLQESKYCSLAINELGEVSVRLSRIPSRFEHLTALSIELQKEKLEIAERYKKTRKRAKTMRALKSKPGLYFDKESYEVGEIYEHPYFGGRYVVTSAKSGEAENKDGEIEYGFIYTLEEE